MVVWRNSGEAPACTRKDDREYFTVAHNEYVAQNATGIKEASGRRVEGAVRQPEIHRVQHIVQHFGSLHASHSFSLFPLRLLLD